MNSLSVWQPGEDVNDLGESIDQPMELMGGGDREGDTEGVELEVRGLEFMDEEEEVDETEPESEGDESGWRAWEWCAVETVAFFNRGIRIRRQRKISETFEDVVWW